MGIRSWADSIQKFFYGVDEAGSRREWIMMDVEGPGAVVRWWLTQQNFKGIVRIYLDDSDEPIYAATADKIVGGTAITQKPLSNVVGWNGRNLYLLIPSAKHCKITYDGPNQQETGQFPDYIYHNINYIRYPDGTDVKTFTREYLLYPFTGILVDLPSLLQKRWAGFAGEVRVDRRV